MSTISQSTPLVMSVKNAVERADNLPDNVEVLLFGSACYRSRPNDIDILFVYNPEKLSARDAYSAFRPVARNIENATCLRVYSIVMSADEANSCDFITKVEAIHIASK